MLIKFNQGRIIANNRDIMIKLEGDAKVTLQAQVDEISLLGGANVITALGSGLSWSLRLDNREQLDNLAAAVGIPIQEN
ncbi:conserved hypothetical protein [Psychromonas ingrahamii 37]|uniref:Phosphotransferase system IIA component n=1 Tax=Psychromonas ingrahamii (strain DSM 17664 / CCUG 51855 / 37) TaxID=357804 RepID=A1SUR7_PSYIN|nr:DUF3389 domain-containing protein [Psychromonas ingrahamii]ABM03232.1 conserved hypothetical protein [Psychromonas ingrahamii 37]